MKINETPLPGAFLIESDKIEDSRGYFTRTWCEKEFSEAGMTARFVQANLAYNKLEGTLRGMHMQYAPHSEDKLVRCTSGALYDVIIDLRPESDTHGQWFGAELSAGNLKSLYVPKGFAHGYQTLTDDASIVYQVTEFYTPQSEGGVRWNDSFFNIDWPPFENRIISEKDMSWPDYQPDAD